jgi:hypothetical protein
MASLGYCTLGTSLHDPVSVAKGLKFWLQITKGAEKNCMEPGK